MQKQTRTQKEHKLVKYKDIESARKNHHHHPLQSHLFREDFPPRRLALAVRTGSKRTGLRFCGALFDLGWFNSLAEMAPQKVKLGIYQNDLPSKKLNSSE